MTEPGIHGSCVEITAGVSTVRSPRRSQAWRSGCGGHRVSLEQQPVRAFVVMSPETYDEFMDTLFRAHTAERGHIWTEALERMKRGERGQDARQAIQEIADELGLKL